MKKWLVGGVICLALLSIFISLAGVEKQEGELIKEVDIQVSLDKIIKQNQSILEKLDKVEQDLEYMKKELQIIKNRV